MFKPLTLSAQVTYVSSADPAVDWDKIVEAEIAADPELSGSTDSWESRRARAEAKFMARYSAAVLRNPGAWADMLKFKAGEPPTKFVIGVVPPEEVSRIADECKIGTADEQSETAKWRTFLIAIRNIENFGSQPPPKKKVGDVEYVDPDWLRRTFARGLRPVALGVGAVAWAWNRLTEDEIKN